MNTSHSPSAADTALHELAVALRQLGYEFTTGTPATHARVNRRPGNEAASTLQDVFGWSRSFNPEILPAEIFELMQQAQILQPQGDKWRSSLRLSSLHGQLFWHSAFPTDAAASVFFGPDTYRFASAIESWLQSHPQPHTQPLRRAVDICCGAGPGGLLIALAQPQAEVIGVDINDDALRLARINAALAGAENFEPRHSDLLQNVDGNFDFLVANPPYLVDPSQRAYRHGGGPLGAGLSLDILEAALERLAPGGTLLLYTGVAMMNGSDPFLAEVRSRLQQVDAEYSYREVDPDVFGEELEHGVYAQCDRIAAVVLTVTRQVEK